MTYGSDHGAIGGTRGSKLAWLDHFPSETLLVPGQASPWVIAREGGELPPDIPLPTHRLGFDLVDPEAPFAELAIIGVDDGGTIHLFRETQGAEAVVDENRGGARLRQYLTRDFYIDNEYGPVFPMAALAPSGHVVLSGPCMGFRLLGPDGVAIPNRLSKRFGPTDRYAFWGDHVAAGSRLGWLAMGSEYFSLDYQGRRQRTVQGPDVTDPGAFFAFADNRLVLVRPTSFPKDDPTNLHRFSIVVLDMAGSRLLEVPLDVSDHGLASTSPAAIGLDRRGWLWWSCQDDGKLAIGATDLSAGLIRSGLEPTLTMPQGTPLAPTLGAGPGQSGQGDMGSGVCT